MTQNKATRSQEFRPEPLSTSFLRPGFVPFAEPPKSNSKKSSENGPLLD